MVPTIQFRYSLVVNKNLWFTKLGISGGKKDNSAETNSNVELGRRDLFGGPSFFPICLQKKVSQWRLAEPGKMLNNMLNNQHAIR